jgi:hypothetical protein
VRVDAARAGPVVVLMMFFTFFLPSEVGVKPYLAGGVYALEMNVVS